MVWLHWLSQGDILKSRYFGHLLETGKQSIKSQLSAEVFCWLKVKPDLKLVTVADGARDSWELWMSCHPMLKSLTM